MIDVIVHRRTNMMDLSDARISEIIEQVMDAEHAVGDWEIAVVFVDDAEIQRMHRDFMGIDEPTDIMTFPYDSEPGGASGGDLVISVETAAEQSSRFGNSTERELEFLIVHGVLHLLGWDDAAPADRAAMLARQEAILAKGP